MQKPCQDSYCTLFSSYPALLDYHEEQAKSTDMRVAPVYRNDPAGYNGTPVTRGPATMKAGR